MEIAVISVFCLFLALCIIFDISIIAALAAGLFLFWIYGAKKGFSLSSLAKMTLTGILTVKNILITFLLIGVMTSLWRDAGTIAAAVSYASKLVTPSLFVLEAFCLNCIVSVLTGTAFGTAATMGVICASMGTAIGVPAYLTGGAVLAGAYFGDRCSPISTSAILVSTLTKTDLFTNLKNMIKSCAVPLVLSCVIYFAIGSRLSFGGSVPNLSLIFSKEFDLNVICLAPAILILVLSVLRINVKIAMLASIICSLPICVFIQGTEISELLRLSVFGFEAKDELVAPMMNGGGIVSMLKAASIVCLSSSYSDIFRKTGLLDKAKATMEKLASKYGTYIATFVTTVITSMIACNQTLTIILTHQLCENTAKDNYTLALDIEDSAVVMTPLVPWSIASAVVLTSVDCPKESILFAVFLYVLPLLRLVRNKKPSTAR